MLQSLPPPPPPPAHEIVVTALALPDPAVERAFAIRTIDRTRLANAASSQLEQVLKSVAGVQLFRRSDARSGHPTSQGVTLRSLGGNASSRALLVLDGVPQADPFGGWVNWPAYDPAALAEVRVISGGGSVANGPGAVAGTIEMVSSVERGLGGAIAYGTRDSLEGRVNAGAGIAGGTLTVSARGERGDGFVPVTGDTRGPADRPAPYEAGSGRALLLAPLAGAVDLQASADAFRDRRERGTAFTGNRTDGADASLRLVGRGTWQWSALAYGQWRELESSFANVGPGRATAARVSLQDSVPSRAYGGAFELRPPVGRGVELRLGGDVRASQGQSNELFRYVAGAPTRRRLAGGNTVTGGMFGEVAAPLGRLTLSGGARLDRWRIAEGELREWVIATGAVLRDERYADRTGWLPTARAGAVLDAGGGLSLRSSAYLGWRMPTLNELFRPFRAGLDATAANPELDPERLRGAEAGANWRRGPLAIAVTAFANRLTGAIANVTVGSGPGVFPGVGFVAAGGQYRRRQNLDSIRVRGVELSAEVQRGPWSLRTGASYTDARVHSDGSAGPLNGLRPAQTPRFAATVEAGWARRGRLVSLALRHVGPQFEDDLNRRRLDRATTVDAFAALPLAPRLQLTVRGENLLDETVEAAINGDGSIERATPRTLWLGLRLQPAGARY